MKDFFRNNGVLILIIGVLLTLIIAVTSALMGGTADPLSNLAGVITTPLRNGVNRVVNWTEEKYENMFRQDELRAENEELRRRCAELEAALLESHQAAEENERLRNLLGLKQKRRDLEFESAIVTGRGTSSWNSTLTIGKGSTAGIEAGECVVDQYGNLVGVITEVGLNWSTLITVVDSELELGGLIARTGAAAILEGDFALMREGKLKLSFLPESSELIAGDQVLTSGLSGLYPSELVVGRIEEIHTEASGMSRYAVVIPETDLAKLEQVFVVKSFDVVE